VCMCMCVFYCVLHLLCAACAVLINVICELSYTPNVPFFKRLMGGRGVMST